MKQLIVVVSFLSLGIALEAQSYTLSGLVVSQRLEIGLEGAKVWAEGQPDTSNTDAAGFYGLLLPNGTFVVHYEKSGYCDSVNTVSIADSDRVLSVFLPDPRFQCSVTSISEETWPGHTWATTFEISNVDGLCQLSFTITDTSWWLSVLPETGIVLPDSVQEIAVALEPVDPDGREYLSVLTIDHNAANSPYIIPVMMTVSNGDTWGSPVEPDNVLPDTPVFESYPNPFNPTTVISFSFPQRQWIDLQVFDLSGRTVATMVHGILPAGDHQSTFDGTALPSGIYFARLVTGDIHRTQKLVLLK